jgi:hypothetical protein
MVGEAENAITWWAVFSTLGGTIVGSVIGGCTSYFLQRKALKSAKAQRDNDRFEARRAQAYSLFVKMIKIHSNITSLGRSVKDSLEAAKVMDAKLQPWQAVLPLANLPDRVKFGSDEMALLLAIDNSLFNELGPYDDIHSSIIDVFDIYRTKRVALMQPFGADMDGAIGSTGLTADQHRWMAPREFELNGLVETMVQRTEQDEKESWALLERLHSLLRKEFKLETRMKRKVPL